MPHGLCSHPSGKSLCVHWFGFQSTSFSASAKHQAGCWCSVVNCVNRVPAATHSPGAKAPLSAPEKIKQRPEQAECEEGQTSPRFTETWLHSFFYRDRKLWLCYKKNNPMCDDWELSRRQGQKQKWKVLSLSRRAVSPVPRGEASQQLPETPISRRSQKPWFLVWILPNLNTHSNFFFNYLSWIKFL